MVGKSIHIRERHTTKDAANKALHSKAAAIVELGLQGQLGARCERKGSKTWWVSVVTKTI